MYQYGVASGSAAWRTTIRFGFSCLIWNSHLGRAMLGCGKRSAGSVAACGVAAGAGAGAGWAEANGTSDVATAAAATPSTNNVRASRRGAVRRPARREQVGRDGADAAAVSVMGSVLRGGQAGHRGYS